jgi:hypothetical protein
MRTYFAEHIHTMSAAGSVLAVNNTSTGTVLHIESVKVKSDADFTVHGVFLRYPSLATGGDVASIAAADDDGIASRIWRRDSADAAPSFEIRYEDGVTPVVWPTEREYREKVVIGAEPRDDGASVAQSGPLVIHPGESFVFYVDTADGEDLVFGLEIEEKDLRVAHIASAALPGSGNYTTTTYFDVPAEWSALTFIVNYTAAIGSTNARPKVRIAWGDGVTTVLQPIVETTIDASAAPVASRGQYTLEQRYPTAISAGASVMFAVPIDVLPGARKVRLDVAELGDTANPGTVAVTIVGR